MISCAYALLFLQLPDVGNNPRDKSKLAPRHLERLIILGSDQSESFYEAYNNPTPGMFPKAKSQFHITTTLTKKIFMGTNLKAYCSASASALIIAKSISHSESINTESHQNFISTNSRDLSCLKQIELYSTQSHDSEPISAAGLVSDGPCANGNIINLAYRNLISVSGTSHQYAPSNPHSKYKVNMDQAINFRDIVKIEQVYAMWTENYAKYILVWYFGYLHVFKRNFKDTVWLPVTKVGEEKKNGAIIENYIRKHTNFLKTLDGHTGNSGLINKLKNFCHGLSCNSNEMKKKIDDLMVQISSTELVTNAHLTWDALNSDS